MGLLSSENDGELFAEINVTPMVDVMLVLLIIFMVTAPFMIETIGVDLPKANGASTQGLSTPLTVRIDAKDNIFIAEQSFNLEELTAFMRDNPRVKKGEAVYVAADGATQHRALMKVMGAMHLAGVTRLNILAEEP